MISNCERPNLTILVPTLSVADELYQACFRDVERPQ